MAYLQTDVTKVTTRVLQNMKLHGEKIAMLTAYDYSMASLLESAKIDVVLVGDSAANVMEGHKTTLPITLDEMSGVKLLNRTDTKFVTNVPTLMRLLEMASDEYYAQDIDGARIAPYYTVYFDTDDCAMYHCHEAGHANRQKLRVRSYVDSDLHFLEVKTKNNRGRTKKKRLTLDNFNPSH